MGRKSKRSHSGMENVSSANPEVINHESFMRRLEGMTSSSCIGCIKERAKDKEVEPRDSHQHGRRRVKNRPAQQRLHSPIVVPIEDTIKHNSRGKLRHMSKSLDNDYDSGSDDSSTSNDSREITFSDSSKLSSHVGRRFPRRQGKNFHAFLSAFEKAHTKKNSNDFSNNLDNKDQWSKLSKQAILNNARSHHATRSINTQPPKGQVSVEGKKACSTLDLLAQKQGRVELICNDLSCHSPTSRSVSSSGSCSGSSGSSGPSSMSTDSSDSSPEDSEHSENSSVISSTESSDLDSVELVTSGNEDRGELSQEELARLTQYTNGYPLKKLDCLQCLAAFTHYYAYGSDLFQFEVLDKQEEERFNRENGGDSWSDDVECKVTQEGDKKVSVSLANLLKHTRWKPRTFRPFEHNTVMLDLSGTDVTFTVHYEEEDEEGTNADCASSASTTANARLQESRLSSYTHAAQAFYGGGGGYHPFYPMQWGYYPYAVPNYYMPAFWPFPFYSAPLKPIKVPRSLQCLTSQRLCMVPAQDVKKFTASQPPQRPWIPLAHPERTRPIALFTVMCYNVLCDKYATRQLYGYCPSWALNWEYRKKGIIEEIRHYSADIISLQEVETDQFYNFFLPELKRDGYDGIFSPKSRAKTMNESERKYVDGCAIFFRTSKFSLKKEQLVEFNQLAMTHGQGTDEMLNRVMTKDNIGLAAVLETKEAIWDNNLPPEGQIHQPILVATCHVHWDPEFCDVKLIQTMMLMAELKNIVDEASTSLRPGAGHPDTNQVPLLLCGDFNSLPDSGVVEYLTSGRVAANHEDFKELGYEVCLQKLSTTANENKDVFSHNFKLAQAYNKDTIPYTNYTFDFKGIIDYIFYSREAMRPLGLLGALDSEWFRENKVLGCPHPHIPSDHLPLLVEFEMAAHGGARSTTLHQNVRR